MGITVTCIVTSIDSTLQGSRPAHRQTTEPPWARARAGRAPSPSRRGTALARRPQVLAALLQLACYQVGSLLALLPLIPTGGAWESLQAPHKSPNDVVAECPNGEVSAALRRGGVSGPHRVPTPLESASYRIPALLWLLTKDWPLREQVPARHHRAATTHPRLPELRRPERV